jgi:CBS domain-containing protein
MQTPVSSILSRKGDWVITIEPKATVFDTISRMVEHNVGAICVTEHGRLQGIFTERDYLRRIILQGRASKDTRVEEVMTKDVICARPDHTADDCMAMMTEKKCRHLPVLRDGQLAGIISLGDCVKVILEATEDRVRNLEHFITGGYPG